MLALFGANGGRRRRVAFRILLSGSLVAGMTGSVVVTTAGPVLAAVRPSPATSYYLRTVRPATLTRMGCNVGRGARRGSQPKDALVVLAMGRPRRMHRRFGASLFGSRFASNGRIADAGVSFARGFRRCAGRHSKATLRIALGTSNYGKGVSYDHGRAWARMINKANRELDRRGWSDRIDMVGADDIELMWNGPRKTKAWVRGYDSANEWPYYDFGDAAGCPPYGWCAGAWTIEDVWWVAWGAPPAIPLPEMYTRSGASARQWYRIGLYSAQRHGSHMVFAGVMSQRKACRQSADPCRGMNNSPARAWRQFTRLLNSRRETAQRLRFATDIAWRRR